MGKEIPFTELIALASDLWDERKGLDFSSRPAERKRIIKRMEKQLEEIKKVIDKFPQEIEIIKQLYE